MELVYHDITKHFCDAEITWIQVKETVKSYFTMAEKHQSDNNNGSVWTRLKRIANDDQNWCRPAFQVVSFMTIREVAPLNTRRNLANSCQLLDIARHR